VGITGNLTRDPVLRFTPGNKPVTDIGVAINERSKVGDEWKDTPVFIDVTVWGQSAEYICNNAQRGSKVAVSGRLAMDQWTDNQGGKRSKIKVTADRVELMGSRGPADQRPANENYGEESQAGPVDDDDVPF
jgi:single-strand DNA-binding protein